MFLGTRRTWWRFCYDTTIRKTVTDADDIKPIKVVRNGRRGPSVELGKLGGLSQLRRG